MHENIWKKPKIKEKKFQHQTTERETGGSCEFKYKKIDRVTGK